MIMGEECRVDSGAEELRILFDSHQRTTQLVLISQMTFVERSVEKVAVILIVVAATETTFIMMDARPGVQVTPTVCS